MYMYVNRYVVGNTKMDFDQNKYFKDWMKFLDVEEVKFQLITASLYLTGYDLLLESVVQKTKDFYSNGFDENGWNVDEKYKTDVHGLYKKDIVIASLMWLEKNKVITEHEIDRVKLFKDHRNELAHELSKMISDSDKRTKTEYIPEIRDLYLKIHKWWFVEFEMAIDPELGKLKVEDLDFSEVLSFIMMPMDYMVNIVNDEIKKRKERKNKAHKKDEQER